MDKAVVYKTTDGGVGILRPTDEFLAMAKAHVESKHKNLPIKDLDTFILEYVAHKDVPKGLDWRIVDKNLLPSSRNWRDAWTDENPTETVDVDLEKAKEVHKRLIVAKAYERVDSDEFNNQDFSQVKAEIEAIDFDSIKSLEELYNTFPSSIDKRDGKREYVSHSK